MIFKLYLLSGIITAELHTNKTVDELCNSGDELLSFTMSNGNIFYIKMTAVNGIEVITKKLSEY